jgi:hypothetical protein
VIRRSDGSTAKVCHGEFEQAKDSCHGAARLGSEWTDVFVKYPFFA